MPKIAVQLDSADWVYADVTRDGSTTTARVYNVDVLDAEAADAVFANFTNAVSAIFPKLQIVREDRFARLAAATPTEALSTEAPVDVPADQPVEAAHGSNEVGSDSTNAG